MAVKICSRFLKRRDREQVSPQRLAWRLITAMTGKIIDDDDDSDENTEDYEEDD